MAKSRDDDLFKDSVMTFGEHLEELRSCLWKAVLGLVIGVIIGLYLALLGLFIAGGVMLITGPFSGFSVSPAVALVLCGLGMMAGAVAFAALLTIVATWLVNGLLWFGRLHYRVIEPAIKPERSMQ